MIKGLFEKKMSNLFAENRLLKFYAACMTMGMFWLGYQVNDAVHHQRTILVPAGLDRKVSITDGYASEDYIKLFARNITNLAFTYNSGGARGQFGELLSYFTADTFPAAKKAFYELADTIERTRLSSSFAINRPIEVDVNKGVITIVGSQRQWVDSNFVDAAEKTYGISYKLLDGRFFVTSIDEIKNGPSTQKSNAQNQTSAQGIKVDRPADTTPVKGQ